MSRFCKTELTQAIGEMEGLLKKASGDAASSDEVAETPIKTSSSPKLSRESWSNPSPRSPFPQSSSGIGKSAGMPLSSFASASASSASSATPGPALDGAQLPSHETIAFADAELTDDKFRQVWEKGVPLVVNGLSSKFHIQWTPEYFSTQYGSQSCLILECQNEQNKRVTVSEFFSLFGKYEGRRDCWKLKVRTRSFSPPSHR